MAVITVEFRLGTDWQSRAIARYGHGPNGWSHVANVLKDGRFLDARDDELAGVPPGIHIRDPQSEPWARRRIAWKAVPDSVYDAWEANLRAKIGDRYAERDILGFFLNRMLHRVATYDCSALTINALQHVKLVPFPLATPAHQLTPNDVLLAVQCCGFELENPQSREEYDWSVHEIDK